MYGQEPIENVLGGICLPASEIVYFGTLNQAYFEEYHLAHIKRYYAAKGLSRVKLSYIQVKKNNIDDAVTKLDMSVPDNGDWVIDVIGGDDALLCAAGIVSERAPNVTLCRIDPINGYTYFLGKAVPDLPARVRLSGSVEENIMLHGGTVSPYIGSGAFTYDDEFISDIKKLWRICAQGPRGYVHKRSAPHTWNRFVLTAAGIDKMSRSRQAELIKSKYKVRAYLELLRREGLISYRQSKDGSLENFRYKNSQVRECIVKAGNILEQKVYLACKKHLGRGLSDVRTGVCIQWNADRNLSISIENEIDVLAMRGICPIFISCKNGKFESEELYKLSSVAERFGGKYAKKILVATDLLYADDMQTVRYLKARASEMGIKIIENVQRMNDAEFEKVLKVALFS